MNSDQTDLEMLLKSMDIPHFRKQIDKNNLKWLLKNLGKRNHDHPNYDQAMELVNRMMSMKSYTH